MGCDYYETVSLSIDFLDPKKKSLSRTIDRHSHWISDEVSDDYTREEQMEQEMKRCSEFKKVYDHQNQWLIRNQDLIHEYEQIIKEEKCRIQDIKQVTRVHSCYPR